MMLVYYNFLIHHLLFCVYMCCGKGYLSERFLILAIVRLAQVKFPLGRFHLTLLHFLFCFNNLSEQKRQLHDVVLKFKLKQLKMFLIGNAWLNAKM
jgi:hypothetical protein